MHVRIRAFVTRSSRRSSTTTRKSTATERRLAEICGDSDDRGMKTLYEAAGGMEGMRRLAAAWHPRVMADEVVSHAFSHGFHPEHVERLATYWAEALGGLTAYTSAFGDEAKVERMHGGNGEHEEMNRRAIACFDEAL
jgi:hemoglobin